MPAGRASENLARVRIVMPAITSAPTPEHRAARPFAAILLLFAAPLFASLLAAPWLYPLVKALGFGEARFDQVAGRVSLAVAVLVLVPAFRLAGFRDRAGMGLPAVRAWPWGWLRGWLIGCASMAAVYFVGWLLGVFVRRGGPTTVAGILAQIAAYLVGAVFIGIVEELLFRGFLFRALRRAWAFVPAAIAASAFFASLHIIRPAVPEGLNLSSWDAGLRLLPHLFDRVDWEDHLPMLVTLFLMGLALCTLVERQKHLYFVMGLHAGWVWIMRMAVKFSSNDGLRLRAWFGLTDEISKSWTGVLFAAAFLAAVIVIKPQAGPTEPRDNRGSR